MLIKWETQDLETLTKNNLLEAQNPIWKLGKEMNSEVINFNLIHLVKLHLLSLQIVFNKISY